MDSKVRKRSLLCLGKLLEKDTDLIRIEASVHKNSFREEEYLENILLACGDVLSGNLFPTRFGFCHPTWDGEKQRAGQRNKFLLDLTKPGTFLSKAKQCGKCGGSGDVSYVVAQTRRGDEGATTFLNCSKCRSKWTA